MLRSITLGALKRFRASAKGAQFRVIGQPRPTVGLALLALLAGCGGQPETRPGPPNPGIGQLDPISNPKSRQAEGVQGTWTIKGTGAAGHTYMGTLMVVPRNEAFALRWSTTSLGSFAGVGLQEGKRFFAVYGTAQGVSLGVYRVAGEQWVGRYVADSDPGRVATETISLAGGTAQGTHAVQGPDYRGRLRVARTGDTYHVERTVGGRVLKGIGYAAGGLVGVAFSEGGTAGLKHYMLDGPRMAGGWAVAGMQRLLPEALIR